MKIKAALPIILLLCLTGCGRSYSNEEVSTRTSPPLERKWDISAKDNLFVLDFEADWGSPYRLYLNFRPIHEPWTQEEKKQFKKFLGDGSQRLVTAESAHSDHPVAVPPYTQEDLNFMEQGGILVSPAVAKNHSLKSNERVITPSSVETSLIYAYPGTIIPVHVKVERLDSKSQAVAVVKEYDASTKGANTFSGRDMGWLDLPSGHYRLSINTTKAIKLPPNTESSFGLYRRSLK